MRLSGQAALPLPQLGGPGRNFIRRRTLRLAFGFLGQATVLYKENLCKIDGDISHALIRLHFEPFPSYQSAIGFQVEIQSLVSTSLALLCDFDLSGAAVRSPNVATTNTILISINSPTFADSFPTFAYY